MPNGRVNYNTAIVINEGYKVDTVATFSCNREYSLAGVSSRTCQTSGSWNEQSPTCNQSNKINLEYLTTFCEYSEKNICLITSPF